MRNKDGKLDEVAMDGIEEFIFYRDLMDSLHCFLLHPDATIDGSRILKRFNIMIDDTNTTKLDQIIEFLSNDLKASEVSFSDREKFYGAQQTGGAIFESNIDRSHPVNYGIESNTLPLFRNSNIYMSKSEQSFNNPILYSSSPLLSGYISEENLSLLKNSVPFKVIRSGKGKIMLMTDNTNFRAFWYGSNRVLLNMLFHSNIM